MRPEPMSAQMKPSVPAIHWQAAPRYEGRPPAPELLHWLTYEGLLTVRLKLACPDGFRLQLLEKQSGAGLLVADEPVRRIILWCGDLPCVYAESHLPSKTLALLPRLRSLGSDPLGEALQSQPGVGRGPFEYAALESLALPVPLGTETEEPLWARRSNFLVGDSSLTVAEVFLPGILALGDPCSTRSES